MPGYLPQLSRPIGAGDRLHEQARQQSQSSDMSQSSNSAPSHLSTASQQRSMSSSLVQWQVTTAAGLRDKEAQLKMTKSLADRQQNKIVELRKSNEMLGTDVGRSKEENQTLAQSLSSTKEDVEVLAKQIKTVSSQIRRIQGEREELLRVEEERNEELSRLASSFQQLHLSQDRNEKSWMEKIKGREEVLGNCQVRTKEDEKAATGQLRFLEERLLQIDDEKYNAEKQIESEEKELVLLGEMLEAVKKNTSLIKLENNDVMNLREKKDLTLRDEIRKLIQDEEINQKDTRDLSDLLSEKAKLGDQVMNDSSKAEQDIFKLETEMSALEVKRTEFEKENNGFKNHMLDNTELVESLKKKVEDIAGMKTEMEGLEETLKQSEEKRITAENEYKHLGNIQEEKKQLEEENLELSERVHVYEDQVQHCKTDISAAQEELKLKTKGLGLLESKVLELNASKRNNLNEFDKVRKLAESKGKTVSVSKSCSSDLQTKLESLKSELKTSISVASDKKEIVAKMEVDVMNQNELLKSLTNNLQGVSKENKRLNQNIVVAKSALTSKARETIECETKNNKLEIENKEISAGEQVAQDNLKTVKNDIEAANQDLKTEKDRRDCSEMKNKELKEMNMKVKGEHEKIKKDLVSAKDELQSSDDKLETSEGMKTNITEKTIEIKKLEKEIKNTKRNLVTVTKRKEKMVKQLDKNKTVSDSIGVNISLIDQKIIQAKENLTEATDHLKEKANENLAKNEAVKAVKMSYDVAADEAVQLSKEVSTAEGKQENVSVGRNKLYCEIKQDAQEFQGLLNCKEKEFSDIRAKLNKEVVDLGKTVEAMKRELEVMQQTKISSEVDDEFPSPKKDLLNLTEEAEAAKEESSKLAKKLAEREAQVTKLKEKLQSMKTRSFPPPASRSRTPLRSLKARCNDSTQQAKFTPPSVRPTSSLATADTSQLAKQPPSSHRQSRTLLPSLPNTSTSNQVKAKVSQSPFRSFLAPPPRPTPTSQHSRPKKKTPPSSTPRSDTPVMDFDSVMGVSDDLDSN
eukprot:GFUD01027926.1.p1 GENE.GFUD01027926.1~~GFUD01027926.1.p1  ORF type:complete len:1030 (-),score=391.51 GFUD01027926.1:179-3268(-)